MLRRRVLPALLGLAGAAGFLVILVAAGMGRAPVIAAFADFLDVSVPTDPLQPGETWIQRFDPGAPCLTRVEVLVLTYGGSNDAPVRIGVTGPDGREAASRSAPERSLRDGQFLTLDLDPACDLTGPLAITVGVDEALGTPIALWTNPRSPPGSLSREPAGSVPPGSLVFRAYVEAPRSLYTRLDADKPAGLGSIVVPAGLAIVFALITGSVVLLARSEDPPDTDARGGSDG